MANSPGTRLGPYEVLSSLGAGGMGEVYRARDTRLGREVAVKIIPEALAGPQALERFEREARAVAQLSHPNILAIHDFGREGETAYAVMELLEGETLRQRLGNGALPARKAVDLAAQIAEGLAAAHEKGIVHRDLKPENVFITSDGRVKLLDFGLAKATTPASGEESDIRTESHATDPGTVLGTARYMSPEQVRGEAADPRSDIFSFGVVLYEMLTGKQAFKRETTAESMAAILKEEPPEIGESASAASPALQRIVHHCLEKKPGERFQSARDVAFALQAFSGSAVSGGTAVAAGAGGGRRLFVGRGAAFAAGALLAVACATPVFLSLRQQAADNGGVLRVQLVPGRGERLNFGLRAFAISPDGTKLAYVVAKGATTELRLRALDSLESRAIPGTDAAGHPFFSPDGKWIAFNGGVKLKKVAVSGGSPVTIADAVNFRGGVWGEDGRIYYVPNQYVPIARIPSTGGSPDNVTRIRTADGELQHRWPELLPGGKVLLYVVGSGGEWDDATIVAEKLETGERKVLVKGGSFPRYLPTGHLVYSRAGALYAVPFDARSLAVEGSPVEVARDVYIDSAGFAQMDLSRSGVLVTAPRDSVLGDLMLSWVDRAGRGEPLRLPRLPYANLSLSPDGSRVAMGIGNGIGVVDLGRVALTRLSLGARADNPIWSGDGRRLYFGLEKGSHYQVFWKAADDSGSEQLAFPSDSAESPLQMSADGSRMLTFRTPSDGRNELLVREMGRQAEGREPRMLIKTAVFNTAGAFAPGGRYVTYESLDPGRPEIYVRPTSGEDRKWQVSSDGGAAPLWSPDGKEIFFLSGMKFMAVPVELKGDDFRAGAPKVLFENHEVLGFDVSRDGRRFLVAENPNPGISSHLDVVTNWPSEVRRKVLEAKAP